MTNSAHSSLHLWALVGLLGLGCSVTTSTCTTCFVNSTTCQTWSGNEVSNREITARKLCTGEVPTQHEAACAAVLKVVHDGPRVAGGQLKAPLSLPSSDFEVRCSESTRADPLRGCGGFN